MIEFVIFVGFLCKDGKWSKADDTCLCLNLFYLIYTTYLFIYFCIENWNVLPWKWAWNIYIYTNTYIFFLTNQTNQNISKESQTLLNLTELTNRKWKKKIYFHKIRFVLYNIWLQFTICFIQSLIYIRAFLCMYLATTHFCIHFCLFFGLYFQWSWSSASTLSYNMFATTWQGT